MFNIQSREIREAERKLKAFASQSLPDVTQRTLNDTAFDAMCVAKANVENNMINRNTWTQRSIRVDKAGRGSIRSQKAFVGSTEAYMEDQEFGGTKEGHSIPTTYSAGQSPSARKRTRVPRKANRTGNIQLAHRRRGSSRAQRNFIAVRSGEKFVYLDLGHRRGLFRITGGKRNPRVNMVQDLTRSSTPIPKNPWLKPAFDESLQRLPAYYADALRSQLRRQGLD